MKQYISLKEFTELKMKEINLSLQNYIYSIAISSIELCIKENNDVKKDIKNILDELEENLKKVKK